MIKLKTYKFNDLYKMSSGISSKPEQAGHGSPFVSFSTVFNNCILPDSLPDLMDISEEEKEIYSIKKGDILLTRTSETLNELGMSCIALKDYPESSFSGFVKRLRPTQKDVTYDKFMAFYLRSKLFRKTMNNNAIMTLRASLNENIFSYLDLILPEIEEQKKIGDFLYIIHSIIELNKKMDGELEALGKIIYDYWFIQFDFPNENGNPYKSSGGKMVYNEEIKRDIPYGWEVITLGEACDLYQPITIAEKDLIEDGEFLVFGANGIVGRYNKFNHENSEIVVTCRGNSCGTILRTIPFSWITGNAMVIKSKIDDVLPEFIFQLLQWIGIKNAITGSAQPQITRTNLETLKLVLPPKELLIKYNSLVSPNVEKRLSVFQENQILIEFRDWLLPMLMNGQVTVGEAQEKLNIAAEPNTEYENR